MPDYFICGESTKKDRNGLPDFVSICPIDGADWSVIYIKSGQGKYSLREDKGFTTDVMEGDRYIGTFVNRKFASLAVAALNAYVNSQERNANSSAAMGQAPASVLEENVLEKGKEKE